MDVQTLESELKKRPIPRWLARERESGRIYDWATIASVALFAGMLVFSYIALTRVGLPGSMLSPGMIAGLLIGNLIPAIVVMVLLSRRIARARAVARAIGTGQLHTRLVALFSVIAAVPTVIIAIFASFLLQSGLDFWFSDRAKGMLENTVQLAQSTYSGEVSRVAEQAVPMAENLSFELKRMPLKSSKFEDVLAAHTYYRSLNEAAIIEIEPNQPMVVLSGINYFDGLIDPSRVAQALTQLKGQTQAAEVLTPGRIAVLTPVP